MLLSKLLKHLSFGIPNRYHSVLPKTLYQCLVLLLAVLPYANVEASLITDLQISGKSIVALDKQSNTLWTFEANSSISLAILADFDQDNEDEALIGTKTDGSDRGVVYAIDTDGTKLWSFKTGASGAESPYWKEDTFVVNQIEVDDVDGDGKQEVITSSYQTPYYPARLLVLSHTGIMEGEYWHPGRDVKFIITDFDGNGVKDIIGCSGNNDLAYQLQVSHIGVMFRLRGNNISGEAPPDYGDFPSGSELWYAANPNSKKNCQKLELVDITGDGIPEIKYTDQNDYVWYVNADGCSPPNITPTSRSHSSNGETGNVTVSVANTNCKWTAKSNNPDWLTITSGSNSIGNATVTYFVKENSSSQSRIGTLTIAGRIFTISQEAPYELTVTKTGTGQGSITGQGISCGSDCAEKYVKDTAVTLTANPNSGSSFGGWGGACSGTGSCQVTMNQAKNVTATFNLNSFALSVNKYGSGTGKIIGEGINCGSDCSEAYEANSSVTLIATPDSGSLFIGWNGACSGTGNCQVTLNQAKNVTATFDKRQCSYQITPTSQTQGSNVETGTVTVSVQSGCTWTAQSNINWANITSGSTGEGNGSVTYSITANPTPQNRRGTLTIAGQTFTFFQNQIECSYSITPTHHTHSANGETGSFSVKAATGCQWTAHSTVPWVNVTAGQNGQGAGIVTYSIDPNSSQQNRQGTLTIAGQTYTVNQEIPGNTPPISVISVKPTQGTSPLTVTTDGRASSDKEGIIKTYAWTTSDGQTASTPKAAFTFTTVGTYNITLTVTDEKDLSNSKTATVRVIPPTTRLINLSTRARIQGGAGDVFAGFGISGAGTQKILLRGKSLEAGVDPQLLLQKYPTQEVLGSNNNWQEDPRHAEIPDYMRPLNATDAALLRDLGNGYYTVQLSSLAAKALGIVEVILVPQTPTPASQLFNISTRALVQGGAYDIIAGFIIEGEGLQKVVIRGTAVDVGVDPVLIVQELGKTEVMAQNNNWQDDPRAPEIPPHLQPSKATDAALLLSLPKGAYTVILTSLGAKKLGLIEVVAVD